MKKFAKVFDFNNIPLSGECDMNVDELIKVWDDKMLICEHTEFISKKKNYQLMRDAKNAPNFTKTNLKLTISEIQALDAINRLNLVESYKRGSTILWKTK